jgi:FG-GAP repeat
MCTYIYSEFGYAVAVSRSVVIATATGSAPGEGSAYIYSRGQGTLNSFTAQWSLQQTLYGDATASKFGQDVATWGDFIVVTAPVYASAYGGVFIFHMNSTASASYSYSLQQILTGKEVYSTFGSSVSISDGLLAVGASGYSNYAGAVYLYR